MVAAATLLTVLAATPRPAAAFEISRVRGHLAVGYGKLFIGEPPGGSMSMAGGVELPITDAFSSGIEVGYHLMGSHTELRGSLLADVDYSLFETSLLLYWTPPWRGPVGRISFGPGLYNARAELSASGGGAGFTDLAVDQTAAGLAAGVEFLSRKPSVLRLGAELGARLAFVSDEAWSGAVARVVVHY
jgi:hypothetical protein